MRTDEQSQTSTWWWWWLSVGLFLGGLGALSSWGLLFYYGDVDVEEYRWKGPVSAVVITIVCLSAVAALQHPALPGWARGVGYVALIPLSSFLAFSAAGTYYSERCNDPGHVGDCGVPELAAMLWTLATVVIVIAVFGLVEIVRRRRRPRLAAGAAGAAGQPRGL